MTNSTTQITTTQQQQLVESSSSSSSSASESSKNPFIPFFPNFNFNFQLPHFFNLPAKKHQHDDGGDKNKATTIIPKLQEGPNVVTFPKTQLAVVSEQPLQAESQISSTKTSNPLILYQVYAVGAFFISRWIWARWNERKARGRSSDEDGDGDDRGSQDNV
ncbi:uncharacterized protein [Medicago truncatula]|uniref:uncharacterized protein isoform X2 n=1 Tax=Medicago truncatula TaxID=3880 RepID=UPI001968465F|nr:uncharacterized protein LOC25485802 isoform X2 [Medicago truncatula]